MNFKSLLLSTGLAWMALSCSTPPGQPDDSIIVRGTLANCRDTEAVFTYTPYELLASQQKEIVRIGSDGTFRLFLTSLKPVKGFFSFGRVPKTYQFTITTVSGRDSSLSVESADFRMVYLWLEPGDSLNMNVDVDRIGTTLSFSGRGSANNRFVNAEAGRFDDYSHRYLGNYYGYTFMDPVGFSHTLADLAIEKATFLKAWSDTAKLSPSLIETYRADYQEEGITKRIAYPGNHANFNNGQKALLPPGYWSFLDSVQPAQEIGDRGIGYYYFLNTVYRKKYDMALAEDPEKGDFYSYLLGHIPVRTGYEFLAYALARDFRKDLYERFGPECPFPDLARKVRDKYRHLEGMLEGNPAPAFTLEDVDGKPVSLSDLLGSYVYVDFWATWCGPCKKEIPYLKKTVQEYRNRNIRFVSISYDKPADREKWRSYVRDNRLSGIQLIASPEMKALYDSTFNIDLIPRFILLDPKGRIVSGNAPRPSAEGLKELLDRQRLL
jgi:thiol-disulfide isomerase/thioredoxin